MTFEEWAATIERGEITINPQEWPALRDAIDQMVKECRI